MWMALLASLLVAANAEEAGAAGAVAPAAAPAVSPPPARPMTPAEAAAMRNSLFLRADPAVPGGWWVETGARSGPLSTLVLVRAIGDAATQQELERAKGRLTTARAAAGVLGVAGVVGGLMVAGSAGPSVRLLPQPDPRDYPDTDTYADAERKWARRQGAADERDEALTDGIVLTALGGLCFAVIPLAGGDVTTRLQHPGLVYTLPTAQEAVDRYNQAIRVRFGVASVTVEVP